MTDDDTPNIPPAGDHSTPADIAAAAERVRRVTGAVRREDTLSSVELHSGWYRLTWTSDDIQLMGISDGFVDEPGDLEAFHNRVYIVRGGPTDIDIERVPGYPNMIMRLVEADFASYWGSSILAADGRVYRFMWTANHPYLREDGSFWPDFRAWAAKLVYSPDNGTTWNNQDGSHPVVWENWDARTRENMAFLDEPHDGLAWGGTFLQMGQDYSLNTDGYIYVYFGMGEGDDLGLYRAPRGRFLERESYEFFTGRTPEGLATWSSDVAAAASMHEFPPGWVSTKTDDGMLPFWWSHGVTYNPGLGVYLLAAQGVDTSDEGGWFAGASYLGMWAAPTPWGPFTQFHEETAWTPGGDRNARAFAPDIPAKWIAADGRSFWLVWSDSQFRTEEGEDYGPDAVLLEALGDLRDGPEFVRAFAEWNRRNAPNVVLHLQRVDLTVRDEDADGQ